MDWINLYGWAIPSQDDFLQRYQDDDSLYQMAQNFWDDTSSVSLYLFILMLIVGVVLWFIHYFWWCKKPGRHYRLAWWFVQLAITFVLTAAITLGMEKGMVSTELTDGIFLFQLKLALGNGLFGTIIYFLLSLIINLFLPTRTCAYPFWSKKRK